MPRSVAVGVVALVLGMVVVACGGSESEAPPSAPATATAAPATTEATPATPEATAAPTEASTPAATPTQPPATTAAATSREPEEESEFVIVTLLPPDAIPAISNPSFITADEADAQLRLTDLVIGVSIEGEHRAYGAAFLSGHEIVNDTLGGRAIAVTW